MNKQELIKTIEQIDKDTKIPGTVTGKFYSFVGIEKYSGRGRYHKLKGEEVIVLQSGERKKQKIILFIGPLIILANSNMESLSHGKLPSEYIHKYRSGIDMNIPNLFEYETHYKSMARFLKSL